ncbi:hypothetical protein BT67DRAFT_191202 [Trichocladium antarcticum]|uniref:Uncharacterized protein n=1 Tax=Trichocladium antarcticum TaxID=1450529 RepID=A0AAN6ZGB2_9PEZI|nr:hypothetical protein BT67DRAFT_191202 [Trichocladium antarcticum]
MINSCPVQSHVPSVCLRNRKRFPISNHFSSCLLHQMTRSCTNRKPTGSFCRPWCVQLGYLPCHTRDVPPDQTSSPHPPHHHAQLCKQCQAVGTTSVASAQPSHRGCRASAVVAAAGAHKTWLAHKSYCFIGHRTDHRGPYHFSTFDGVANLDLRLPLE